MYVKLALRNAGRSLSDYFLYILSMILLVCILCISNGVAVLGDRRAGFQTLSLPVLIALVILILADYMNRFIMKQRARELSTYLLLGMEKNSLSVLFLLELGFIGLLCFLCGGLLGTAIGYACFRIFLQAVPHPFTGKILRETLWQTFVCFGVVEVLSFFLIKGRLKRLEIVRLMREKQRNQRFKPGEEVFMGRMLAVCFVLFTALLAVIASGRFSLAVSVIAIPMLGCIGSFYQWLYASLYAKREAGPKAFYQSSRLYQIAEMTGASRTDAVVNAVFGLCLIFSAFAFVFGTFLLRRELSVYPYREQQWMGFLQMMICLVFLVIYFSVLSLMQILALRRQAGRLRLLYYMGKDLSQIKALLTQQVFIRLFLPTPMAFLLLLMAAFTANYTVSSFMPAAMQNAVISAAGVFFLCFVILYLCYFAVVRFMSVNYIQSRLKKKF